MSDNLPKELIVNPSSVKDIKVIVKEAIKASQYEDTGFVAIDFENANDEYGLAVDEGDSHFYITDFTKFVKALLQVHKGNAYIFAPLGNYATITGDGIQLIADVQGGYGPAYIPSGSSVVLAIYPSIEGANDVPKTNVITMFALTLWNNNGKYILQEVEF